MLKNRRTAPRLGRSLTSLGLAFTLLLSPLAIPPRTVTAAPESLLYENKETSTLTSGVELDEVERLYDRGWLEFYALRIDLTNPNVKMNVIDSVNEYGLKETVQNLTDSNDQVAAVNGDFFGTTTLSTSMGTVVENGAIIEARNYYNVNNHNYAGLYIDTNNQAHIDYLKISYIGFLTNGDKKIEIDAKNKVTDMSKPVYIDRSAMNDTAQLDKRFNNLYKIIVENGAIKDISAAGATVTVPENGYLIVMNAATALKYLKEFNVGDSAEYTETHSFISNPSLSAHNIRMGISGGSKIIEAGETKSDGLLISPSTRQPRTAVGISKDKTQLVILAIDGRTSCSIGATHWETAEILREYGAWDAFHLDGGGSTTLAAREEGTMDISVVNTPSEGSQRRVPNALAVTSANATGALASIYLTANDSDEEIHTMATIPVKLRAIGMDANNNPIALSDIRYTVSGADGTIEGQVFTPAHEGTAVITAESGGITGTTTVQVHAAPNAVRITPAAFHTTAGKTTKLRAAVVNQDGYSVDITGNPALKWDVSQGLGTVDANGNFKANANGVTTISASYYSISGSASAAIGAYGEVLLDFETPVNALFQAITGGLVGGVAPTGAKTKEGSGALQLKYSFKEKLATPQTAAINLSGAGVVINDTPNAFGFWMTGDGAGSSVTAVFTDSTGAEKAYSFDKTMTNTDWQYYYAAFPANMELPLTLTRIQVTSKKDLAAPVDATVYFDHLSATFNYRPDASIFQRSLLYDSWHQDLSGAPAIGEYDIAVFGPTAHMSSGVHKTLFSKAIAQMQSSATYAVFAGYTASLPAMSANSVVWNDRYSVTDAPNARIFTLATSKGGLRATNAEQWKTFQNDLAATTVRNVIIVLNKDLNDSNYGFSDARERQALMDTLERYQQTTGANVLVVSGIGNQTQVTTQNGVRYVTLNGLVADGSPDPSNYYLLRLRLNGAGGIHYDLERLR